MCVRAAAAFLGVPRGIRRFSDPSVVRRSNAVCIPNGLWGYIPKRDEAGIAWCDIRRNAFITASISRCAQRAAVDDLISQGRDSLHDCRDQPLGHSNFAKRIGEMFGEPLEVPLLNVQMAVRAAHCQAGITYRTSHCVTEKRDQMGFDSMEIHPGEESAEFWVGSHSLGESLNGDLQRGQAADRIKDTAHGRSGRLTRDFAAKRINMCDRGDDRGRVSEVARPKRSLEHPTMKPVELVEKALLNSSKPRDVVLDAFGGAGTAIIASQRTGRAARAIELLPKYCDAIVRQRYCS